MVLPLFALSGALTAVAYAASLAWNTRMYLLAQRTGWAVPLHLSRSVAVVAALVFFARAGAGPFLAALAGFAGTHAGVVLAMRSRA